MFAFQHALILRTFFFWSSRLIDCHDMVILKKNSVTLKFIQYIMPNYQMIYRFIQVISKLHMECRGFILYDTYAISQSIYHVKCIVSKWKVFCKKKLLETVRFKYTGHKYLVIWSKSFSSKCIFIFKVWISKLLRI